MAEPGKHKGTVLYFNDESTLDYSWREVAVAFWRRYPNPFAAHVLSEDVLDRRVDGNKLITKRLLTKTNPLPRWGIGVCREDRALILEESVVDPVEKTLVTHTRNISLTYFSTVIEKCTFLPSADGSEKTFLRREATFSSGVRFLGPRIASFCRYRYKNNITKSFQGWNFVLKALGRLKELPNYPQAHSA